MVSKSLYTTLPSTKSIRLLRLHPGLGNDLITTSLELIADYSESPSYHAISYCWGDSNDAVGIICNGEKLQVTANAHRALSRLRQKDQCCLLWCDAICINQKNIPERNQQVSIMDKIYRQASRVYVCLDINEQEAEEFLLILREIAHRIHDHDDPRQPFSLWLSQLATRTDMLAFSTQAYPMHESAFSSKQWKLLGSFYQARWFRRVWVIQEIQQASEGWVVCGKSEVEWAIVALVATWISPTPIWTDGIDWKYTYFGIYKGFKNTRFMWDQTFATRREIPFLALLHRVKAFQSSDPRDKVFAMVNRNVKHLDTNLYQQDIQAKTQDLFLTPKDLGIQVDYSLSTKEVYRQVAIQSLQVYKNAEILCYAWQTSQHDESWPSWIPRWDIHMQTDNEMAVKNFLYNASSQSKLDFRLSVDHNVLFLRGVSLGTVVDANTNFQYDLFVAQNTSPGHYTVQDHLQAMVKIITQDRRQDDQFDETTASRTENYVRSQFADFAAYVLPLLRSQGEDCSVSLMRETWCDGCGKLFLPRSGHVSSNPCEFYSCYICREGMFDICKACHAEGMTCEVPSHKLENRTTQALSIPYAESVLEALEAHAPSGDAHWFQKLIFNTCASSKFFSVSQGWHGTSSEAIRPEDVVAILFGSRVPFVLRKTGSGYRLVSICYLQGMMDGEAMMMLKNGELESEVFKIH